MEHQSDTHITEEEHHHEQEYTPDANHENLQQPQPQPAQAAPTNQQQFQPQPQPQPQPAFQIQYQYSTPVYTTQPPNYAPPPIPQHFQPQPSPQHFPPQPGYFPPKPMQTQPQSYQPQQAYKPPNSTAAPAPAPVYQNGAYGPAAPGYMAQQSPYQMSSYAKNPGTVGWSTGLFDCMDDPTNALVTCCCPCFTFGQIAEIVDSGNTTCATSGILYGVIAALIAVPCLISCGYRTKIRNQYDLLEVPAADWLTHCFCEWCALCQEYRELKNRGLDPAIGWHGNMMRNQQMQQQQQVMMMPPVNQTMAAPNTNRQ